MDREWSLKHILRILKRNWWIIILCSLVSTTGAVIGSDYIPVSYGSDTLLLVKSEGLPDSYSQATINQSIQQRIENIKDQVLSRNRLSRIIRKFDLYMKEIEKTSLENAIRIMRQDIKIKIFASVFQITYNGKDEPERIMKVTDELAALFIEENLKYKQQIYSAYQFMERKVRDSQQKVQKLEESIVDFKHKNVGALPEHLPTNLTARMSFLRLLETSNKSLIQVEDEIRMKSKEFELGLDDIILKLSQAYHKKKGANLLSEEPKGEDAASKELKAKMDKWTELKTELSKLLEIKERLLTEYTPQHPAVKSLEDNIVLAQRRLLNYQRTVLGTMPQKEGKTRKESYDYALTPEEREGVKKMIESYVRLRKNFGAYRMIKEELYVAEQKLDSFPEDKIPVEVQAKVKDLKKKVEQLEPEVFDVANILLKEHDRLLQVNKSIYQNELKVGYIYKEIKDYKEKFNFYDKRIQETSAVEQKLSELQRDYQIALKAYNFMIQNTDQAKMLKDLKEERDAGEFIVLDPAYLPTESRFLRNLMIWFVGFIAGVVAGIGLGIQRDIMKPRVEDVDILKKISASNIFTSIPYFRLPKWKMKPVPLQHIWPALLSEDSGITTLPGAENKEKRTLALTSGNKSENTNQPANVPAESFLKNTQQIKKEQLAQVEELKRLHKKDLQRQLRDMEVPIKIGEVMVNKRLLVNNQVYRLLTILEEDLNLTTNAPPIELSLVSHLTTFFAPTSEIASRYRRLRFQIFPRQIDKQAPKKVLFTSAIPGEGKTTTSYNVAGAIATGIADKVIWIECNLAHPLKEGFAENSPKGLANILSEEIELSEVLRQTQFERFKVLPAGQTHLNPSELLASKAMTQLVDQIQTIYPDHLLIFDAPSILSPIDISSLISLVDSLVVVVKAHNTSPVILRKALELIDQSKIAGFVLNGVNRSELTDGGSFEMAG